MSLRVCGQPDCGTLIPAGTREGRCNTHRGVEDASRPTWRERGYDAEYEAYKRSREYLDATHCESCGDPFTADNPRTVGHSIAIRRGGKGSPLFPQCRRENYGWRKSGA